MMLKGSDRVKITLKAARINAGIKQEDAAHELEIASSTLSFIENGIASPRFELVERMCELYNIKIENIKLKEGE